MRILMVSHSAALAGAERSLLACAQYLQEQGHDVVVGVPRKGPLVAKLRAAGLLVVQAWTPWWMGQRGGSILGLLRLGLAFSAVPQWIVHIAAIRPDLIWTNSAVIPSPGFAAAVTRTPHLWFVRESVLTNPSLHVGISRRIVARLIGRYSCVVATVSEYVAGQIESVVGAQRTIAVCPPPIDVSEYSAASAPGLARAVRLLFAGTFTADKGLPDVLHAVSGLRKLGHNVELLIAGSGSPKAVVAMERLSVCLGLREHVRWLGWISDMRSVYADADVLLMTSKNEAYGRVTVEAMAAGLAIVGYNRGGTSEIAIDAGILVEPDADFLAAGIEKLLCSPGELDRRRAMSVAAAAALSDYECNLRRLMGIVTEHLKSCRRSRIGSHF